MARGRKGGPSRMDMRRQAEAAEAREKDEDEKDEAEEEEEAEPDEEAEAEGDEGDEEEGGKKKKKKAPAKKAPAKKPAAKRTRTPKEVRQRAVWVVFDNASKRIDTFPFNEKDKAEELLAKKIEEKKGTFYLNLVKEPIE